MNVSKSVRSHLIVESRSLTVAAQNQHLRAVPPSGISKRYMGQHTTKRILALAAAPLVLAAISLAQPKPAVALGTIACKAMEVAGSTRFAVRLVIFHYRDAADRGRLGQLLRKYDGANVEFQAANGPWSAGTVVRLRACFGRGLLIYSKNEPVITDGSDFLLRFPAQATQHASSSFPSSEIRSSVTK